MVGEDEIPAAEQLLLGLCDHPGASWSIGSQIWRQSDDPVGTGHLLDPEHPDTHLRKDRRLAAGLRPTSGGRSVPGRGLSLNPHDPLPMGTAQGACHVGNLCLLG